MLKKPYTKQRAIELLMRKCSTVEKCSYDITQILIKWGVCDSDIVDILSVLIRDKFIDNQRFARLYVRDKSRFNNWGEVKIKNMLNQKRIPSDMIDIAIKEEINIGDMEQKMVDVLQKKILTIKYKSLYELRDKLLRFGFSRGYQYDLLNKHVNILISKIGEID